VGFRRANDAFQAVDPRFVPYIEHLHTKMQVLVAMAPGTPVRLPSVMCKKGIYSRKETNIFTLGAAMRLRKDFCDIAGQGLFIVWLPLRFGWPPKQQVI
jgi:hypothetical protein